MAQKDDSSHRRRSILRHVGLSLLIMVPLALLAAWAGQQIEDALEEQYGRKLQAIAMVAARSMSVDGLESLDAPDDMQSPAYQRTRKTLGDIKASDELVRYAYVLRHIEGHRWAFVADADDRDDDRNHDGAISEGERATKPGDDLDAHRYNGPLLEGLDRPASDMTPTPDPPWGITVSGYAPMCPDGPPDAPCRKMLLGIDMEYSTVIAQVDRVRSSLYILAAIMTLLLVLAANLYLRSRDLLARSIQLQKQVITAKMHLSKFVPETVRRLIDEDPDNPQLEKTPRDLTVMFIDLAGYTRLSEIMPRTAMNHLIESYFSVFLDAIREHDGDVNETAGDGLMALFLAEDPARHAANAVACARAVQRKTAELNQRFHGQFSAVTINIGISTGTALVGSTRLEGAASSRWTYTASGSVTNLAARLADYATNGTIVVSEETHTRVGAAEGFTALGEVRLKNVSQPTPVFLCPHPRSGNALAEAEVAQEREAG